MNLHQGQEIVDEELLFEIDRKLCCVEWSWIFTMMSKWWSKCGTEVSKGIHLEINLTYYILCIDQVVQDESDELKEFSCFNPKIALA